MDARAAQAPYQKMYAELAKLTQPLKKVHLKQI